MRFWQDINVCFITFYMRIGVYSRTLPVQEGMKLTWNIMSRLLICDLKEVIFLGNDPEVRVCTDWSFVVYIITGLNNLSRKHHRSSNLFTLSMIIKLTDLKCFSAPENVHRVCLFQQDKLLDEIQKRNPQVNATL